MAINDKLNGLELPVNEAMLAVPNGVAPESEGGALMRSRWILLAVRRRRLLIYAGLGAMVAAFILTRLVMHQKYQAQAVIRPTAQQDTSGLGGLLQSSGLLGNSSPLTSQVGGPPDPNELQAILQSYAFTTSMVEQEHLGPKLMKGARSLRTLIPFLPAPEPPSPYSFYKLMSARFESDLSMRTGNMTLTFIDKDPELARSILNLYIDRLRDQVRAQTVRDNKAAERSLEQEAAKATDPLLRDQLYQLAAFQMQQVTTAEANADFAFAVLEPGWVPPTRYAPWVLLDTVAAGVLATLMVFGWLAVREIFPQLRKGLADLDAVSDKRGRDVPVPHDERPFKRPTPESDRPHVL